MLKANLLVSYGEIILKQGPGREKKADPEGRQKHSGKEHYCLHIMNIRSLRGEYSFNSDKLLIAMNFFRGVAL